MSSKRSRFVLAFVLGFFFFSAGKVKAGPLLDKARAYDEWYLEYHCPGLGGAVDVIFADTSWTEVRRYRGQGDSTIHTGAYLASQAFRYAVTKEDAAKLAAKKAALALHHHLKVTGKRGYIARYAGPAAPPFLKSKEHCRKDPRCYLVEGGTYDGYFFLSDTSRDQYDGWFFGYALAYDLVDDPSLQEMIREDVREVIDELHQSGFVISDLDGWPTPAGFATFIPTFRLAWELIAAHVISEPPYWKRYQADAALFLPATALEYLETPAHFYYDYYALMFYHRGGYNIARLDPSPRRRDFYKKVFKKIVRPHLEGADNVFFDYVFMAVTGEREERLIQRDKEVLALFPWPPKTRECRNPPPRPLSPLSEGLARLGGPFKRKALKPYPFEDQCVGDFAWQKSPFSVECCRHSNPLHAYPGIDYLLAYWMGRYHGFIRERD